MITKCGLNYLKLFIMKNNNVNVILNNILIQTFIDWSQNEDASNIHYKKLLNKFLCNNKDEQLYIQFQ